MKTKLMTLLAGLVCVLCISCSKKEDAIVDHLEEVESIMQSNMDDPEKGVKKLIDYFEDNGPEAMSQLAELGIELANIEKDGDREKRFKEVKETMETPMKNLEGTSKKFGEKVQGNKEAKMLAEDYAKKWEQLGRLLSDLGDSMNF